MMAESVEPPAPKRAKQKCHFDDSWVKLFQGICKSVKGNPINEIMMMVIYFSYFD